MLNWHLETTCTTCSTKFVPDDRLCNSKTLPLLNQSANFTVNEMSFMSTQLAATCTSTVVRILSSLSTCLMTSWAKQVCFQPNYQCLNSAGLHLLIAQWLLEAIVSDMCLSPLYIRPDKLDLFSGQLRTGNFFARARRLSKLSWDYSQLQVIIHSCGYVVLIMIVTSKECNFFWGF